MESADEDDLKPDSNINKVQHFVYKRNFKNDFKELATTAWPLMLIQTCIDIMAPISLIFCGHLKDPIKLGGAALAISVINVTVLAIAQGAGTACDTYFNQTVHSTNKTLVGIYVQRAIILFMLTLLPVYAVHINLEGILKLIGQNPQTSRLAAQYMLLFMPGALCLFLHIILLKYLMCLDILFPNVIISIIANVINVALHCLLMYHFDFGIKGSAAALTAAYVSNFLLTALYIWCSGCYKDTWTGWSSECLKDLGPMARLTLSGMFMVGMDWWAYELGLLLSGILGTIELAAMSIMLQFDQNWFQIPLSLGAACAVKVGQRLGAGNMEGAKHIGWLAIAISITAAVIPIVVFSSLSRQLVHIFTNIPDVIDYTATLLPYVGLNAGLLSIGCACKGVLTGTGLQPITAILAFVTYYLIAFPTGISAMFLTSLRVAGYWIGLCSCVGIQTLVLIIIIARINWEHEKQKAFLRNETKKFSPDEQTLVQSLRESYGTLEEENISERLLPD